MACEQAGQVAAISSFIFQALRHMFASRVHMAGVDLPEVKERMGHQDVSLISPYRHSASDHKQEAVEKLVGLGSDSQQLAP